MPQDLVFVTVHTTTPIKLNDDIPVSLRRMARRNSLVVIVALIRLRLSADL